MAIAKKKNTSPKKKTKGPSVKALKNQVKSKKSPMKKNKGPMVKNVDEALALKPLKNQVKSKKSPKKKSKGPQVKNLDEALANQAWSKVKIKGNVISDEGDGFEGLIGLEVLESYDPKMVGKAKRIPMPPKVKRRKAAKNGEDPSDSEDDDESGGGNKSKKEKYAERMAKKMEKRKERREKRKLERKEQGPTAEKEKTVETTEETEYPPERFALLRPPANVETTEEEDEEEDDDEDAVPQLVGSNALSIDDLEGWNGLGVPHPILQAIAERGFKSPTEIQAMTLPAAIMGKKDILGAAETGSGKTLAFGIPILAGIMELKSKNVSSGIRKAPKVKGARQEQAEVAEQEEEEEERELTPPPEELDFFPALPTEDEASDDDNDANNGKPPAPSTPLYAVVLTPTRELAVQVRDHLVAAAKYTGIRVAAIFGGLSVAKQERLLRKCPEIVVATPGRFWELYQQDNPHLSKTDDISFLVIDETDRMLEKGHFEELRSMLKVLNADELKKQSRQNFIFSATLTLVHELPDHMQKRNTGKRPKFVKQTSEQKLESLIAELGISQPKIVDITRSQQMAQNLTECRLICPLDQKDYYLYYFIQRHPGRSIVFCNSIDCVKRLGTLFGLLDCNPLPLHANMIQKQRLKNLERFRDSPDGLLIATDVAARGLDIPNVEHVIHYQVPRTSENYVHRSGRTARANQNGITVLLMEPGEVKNYVKLYRTLEKNEDLPLFPVSERYMAAVKERVDLAREVDQQELKLKRTQNEIGWMKKHAEEMEMIIDGFNDESGSDQDEDAYVLERRRNRMHLANVRQDLKSLLAKQIFPRGFSFKYPTLNAQMTVTTANGNNENSAVKAMKDAIEEMKLAKKMRNKKRKA